MLFPFDQNGVGYSSIIAFAWKEALRLGWAYWIGPWLRWVRVAGPKGRLDRPPHLLKLAFGEFDTTKIAGGNEENLGGAIMRPSYQQTVLHIPSNSRVSAIHRELCWFVVRPLFSLAIG